MRRKRFMYAVIFLFCFANMCIWFVVYTHHAGLLRVSFLNAGGDGTVLITSPTGSHTLFHTGSNALLLPLLARSMPFYSHTIDMVIITNPTTGNISGLPSVLDHYRVHTVVFGGNGSDNAAYRTAMDMISQQQIPIKTLSSGDFLDLGDGVRLIPFFFEDRLVIFELLYGNTCIVFANTMPFDVQSRFAADFSIPLQSNLVDFGSASIAHLLPSFVSLFSASQAIIFSSTSTIHTPEVDSQKNMLFYHIPLQGIKTLVSNGMTLEEQE